MRSFKYNSYFLVLCIFLSGCAQPSNFGLNEAPSLNGPNDEGFEVGSEPLDDSQIVLDSFGERFQKAKASSLLAARYMEQNCKTITSWQNWNNLPMQLCTYQLLDKQAQVLMLNPGIRRLTLWLQNACKDLSINFANCMERSFNRIMHQSGAQFPIAGVVLEDMDGNKIANSYAFRNGVTVRVEAVSSGTESPLSSEQIEKSFTDEVVSTMTFGRPISTTRELMTAYAFFANLSIPDLGTSNERKNIYNTVIGDLYKQAWHSSENHIIRSWIYGQGF